MFSGFSRSILVLAWVLAFAGLAGLTWRNGANAQHFYGIADDLEQSIRFAAPVDIVSYPKVAGAMVDRGELILKVAQPELDAQIRMLDEQLLALELKNRETRASIGAQIVELESIGQADVAKVQSELEVLTQRQRANRSFLGEHTPSVALTAEIRSLQLRARATERATSARVSDLKSQLAQSKRPLDAQIEELRKQQRELIRKQDALHVRAGVTGRVGSLLFQVGDRVPPFATIMTVHGAAPTFVKGFIHEQVLNDVRIAQAVWVQSATQRESAWYVGRVKSLGARIVEFPPRLKVNPMAQAWGREVILELPSEHQLLLGEKVEIQLKKPRTGWHLYQAMKELLP